MATGNSQSFQRADYDTSQCKGSKNQPVKADQACWKQKRRWGSNNKEWKACCENCSAPSHSSIKTYWRCRSGNLLFLKTSMLAAMRLLNRSWEVIDFEYSRRHPHCYLDHCFMLLTRYRNGEAWFLAHQPPIFSVFLLPSLRLYRPSLKTKAPRPKPSDMTFFLSLNRFSPDWNELGRYSCFFRP